MSENEIDPTEQEYLYTQGILDVVDLVEAEARKISHEKEKAGKGTGLTFDDIFAILEEVRRATMERRQDLIVYVKIRYWPMGVRQKLGLPTEIDP